MKVKVTFVILLLIIIKFSQGQNAAISAIVRNVSEGFGTTDSITINYMAIEPVGRPTIQTLSLPTLNSSIQLKAGYPVYAFGTELKKMNIADWLIIEPTDSLIIKYELGVYKFYGRGIEKIELINKLYSVKNKIKKPSNYTVYTCQSISDYLEWNTYLQEQYQALIPIIDSYKGRLSPFAFNRMKLDLISRMEEVRHEKFNKLYNKYSKGDKDSPVTADNLVKIFDSTFFNPLAIWMRNETGKINFIYDLIKRNLIFPPNFEKATGTDVNRRVLFYDQGLKEYKGVGLARFLANFIITDVLSELENSQEAQKLLDRYYSEPGYEEYKAKVKEYETEIRKLFKDKKVPEFYIASTAGDVITKKDLIGKVTILHISNAATNKVNLLTESMLKLESAYKADTNFFYIDISKDRLRGSNEPNVQGNGRYLTINLAEQKDKGEWLLKAFNVSEFPSVFLVGLNAELLFYKQGYESSDLDTLDHVIKRNLDKVNSAQWIQKNDGPYIFSGYRNKQSYSILNGRATYRKIKGKTPIISFPTNSNKKSLVVPIKKGYDVEPCEYGKPQKLLAFSDIEGNFDALTQLLQNNKVIDSNYNWTFGRGHLVFAGDMFDRGNQVTECLWLLYSLEEQAKKSGGYVHFILGNHEIMNLSGDFRYVAAKYKTNAAIMKKSLYELYDSSTELGKWIRSKNIVEKVGDLLFVHGGISKELNELNLSLQQVNEVARPYFDRDSIARHSKEKILSTIYSTTIGPFWYRLYYLEDSMRVATGFNTLDTTFKTPHYVVENTLSIYQAKHIVTGHTIFKGANNYGKHISVHYNNKVINTDTKHATGFTEALMVEDNTYYSVNKFGERLLLFQD